MSDTFLAGAEREHKLNGLGMLTKHRVSKILRGLESTNSKDDVDEKKPDYADEQSRSDEDTRSVDSDCSSDISISDTE